MRIETHEVRIGENMGPIDWAHEWAKDKPALWRAAEQNPDAFLFNGRSIYAVAMYDGWPYWKPTPAIYFQGPIGPEWQFFNGYGVYGDSIEARQTRDDRERRISYCIKRGIDPHDIVADGGCEAWMAVTDWILEQDSE